MWESCEKWGITPYLVQTHIFVLLETDLRIDVRSIVTEQEYWLINLQILDLSLTTTYNDHFVVEKDE